MPERPLLLFPTPEIASRSTLGGGGGRVKRPTPQRQWARLSPVFSQLQTALDARRIEIQQSAADVIPEQVLVMETVGSIENFANAVKRIDGLEWMGEIEIDEITPDEEFYDETKPDKELSGRLYLVMTNQRALDEMLSLWRRYQADPNMQFELGFKKFRDVFLHMKSIRRWDVQDRLLETGLIDIWQENLEYDGERFISFEAELWFRGSNELRAASTSYVTNLVQQAGGRILNQSVIEGIAYHGLLAELPAHAIRAIIESPATELVKCENVMFFRPVGQITAGDESPEGDVEIAQIEEIPLPTEDPIVALFDGLPLANHRLLAGRLVIDDPDNWAAEYSASERIHGTSMASLIAHGDLNQPSYPMSRRIYVRPIMKPMEWLNTPRPEGIPENFLVVDLIHRAVKRLFEGDQEEGAVAPQIKAINLSIGDRSLQFAQSMSPIARLLDWLSVKYGVLFIVSAGNHPTAISLGISRDEFNSLGAEEIEVATIKALYRDARNRKLLAPAETINGISVGAVHHDNAEISYQRSRINPFENLLPSPVSAFGSGYRRAIKPDVVYYGGRQLYRLPFQQTNSAIIEPAIFRVSPGNKTASPGSLPGELDATSYSCGTSNATALLSRAACICYDSLQEIFSEQSGEVDLRGYEVPLMKAMLVHGCSWGDIGDHLKSRIENSDLGMEIRARAELLYTRPADISNEIGRQYKSLIARWIGYGLPDVDRVLDCTDQRATLLGFGELSDGNAHVFRLPLPPSLSARPERRRLTVTLAWFSPISPTTQKYRIASLWFEVNNKGLAPLRQNADWQAVKRGTVQHEVFEGQSAEPINEGDVIEIKVNCREDAGKIHRPVTYGLVVSLEVAEGVDIAVYNEIRTRIAPAIQIQQATDHD
ncbi:S8 family peptidase [Chlorobaculum sp. 24CR]|uniref:S8 family peptidase n=1 Tax=Chlorobaculum sp. 24CR TaxID=2508878 RepID=UPI00100A3081|nr:S8 family peptidase [Chlorobaculum sp. 24CR]RXK87551.1 S8 family peptidase [Chlorobaculum sp. 24CR]